MDSSPTTKRKVSHPTVYCKLSNQLLPPPHAAPSLQGSSISTSAQTRSLSLFSFFPLLLFSLFLTFSLSFVCSFSFSVVRRPCSFAFVRSFFRLFVRSFVLLSVRSFVRSFLFSFFRCSFVRSFVRLFVCSFVRLFVCSFVCSFVPQSVCSFVLSFVPLFIRSFLSSFFRCSFVHLFFLFFYFLFFFFFPSIFFRKCSLRYRGHIDTSGFHPKRKHWSDARSVSTQFWYNKSCPMRYYWTVPLVWRHPAQTRTTMTSTNPLVESSPVLKSHEQSCCGVNLCSYFQKLFSHSNTLLILLQKTQVKTGARFGIQSEATTTTITTKGK